MSEPITLTRKQAAKIIAATHPDYKGRKISLRFTETVTFMDTNWGGGTCNIYAAMNTEGITSTLRVPAPHLNLIEGATINLPANVLIVKHVIFCGTDCGLVIYSNPANAPKLLQAGA